MKKRMSWKEIQAEKHLAESRMQTIREALLTLVIGFTAALLIVPAIAQLVY